MRGKERWMDSCLRPPNAAPKRADNPSHKGNPRRNRGQGPIAAHKRTQRAVRGRVRTPKC